MQKDKVMLRLGGALLAVVALAALAGLGSQDQNPLDSLSSREGISSLKLRAVRSKRGPHSLAPETALAAKPSKTGQVTLAAKLAENDKVKELMDEPEMREIMDFQFVPWGNGQVYSQDLVCNGAVVGQVGQMPVPACDGKHSLETTIYNTTATLSVLAHQYQQVLAQMEYDNTHNYVEKLVHTATEEVSAAWSSIFKTSGRRPGPAGQAASGAQELGGLDQQGKPPRVNFNCQHGFSECAGNAWEACVQAEYPEQAEFFPVIDCIEKRACAEGQKPPAPGEFAKPGDCQGMPADVVRGCQAEYGKHMVWERLNQCMVSKSTILLLKHALETVQQTERQWVPWLVIDDKPVSKSDKEFDQMFLVGHLVCTAYAQKSGKPAPAACAKFPETLAECNVLEVPDKEKPGGAYWRFMTPEERADAAAKAEAADKEKAAKAEEEAKAKVVAAAPEAAAPIPDAAAKATQGKLALKGPPVKQKLLKLHALSKARTSKLAMMDDISTINDIHAAYIHGSVPTAKNEADDIMALNFPDERSGSDSKTYQPSAYVRGTVVTFKAEAADITAKGTNHGVLAH